MGAGKVASLALSGLSSAAGGKGSGGGGPVGGSIDPAMLDFLMQEQDVKQKSQYANEGLGGSTMEAMGRGFGGLQALTQANQFANQTAGNQLALAQQASNLANQQAGQNAFNQGAQSVTGTGNQTSTDTTNAFQTG